MFEYIKDTTSNENIHLICKKDIYRNKQDLEPILLLRKGFEITPDQLPRLRQNGVPIGQFNLESVMAKQEKGRVSDSCKPMTLLPMPTKSQKHAVVLDSNTKNMSRLVRCLMACGLNTNKIHPLRQTEQLLWMLEKYQPEILIVDRQTLEFKNRFNILKQLNKLPANIILIEPSSSKSATNEEMNELRTLHGGVTQWFSLFKPINRFELYPLLKDVNQLE